MTHVQTHLMGRLPVPVSRSANSTSPATSATSSAAASITAEKHAINGGRLKSQLFTYTVTNQVSGAFLELGMPFIMRFIQDWRAGKTTIKEALKKTNGHGDSEMVPATEEEIEKRFLNKVERELALPEYDTFSKPASILFIYQYVRYAEQTISRLCRNGHSVRLCRHLVPCLATCTSLRTHQQLHRTAKRCPQDL